ncbi:uncharacterized protein LOC117747909 isoform X2 [Cyclopterus lumpus]|uniref:uncharacterized protein LOC117747909 isoform X2 n=1 Tax=Cyclopterus lumpus TaxID=8103 RepID=UPI00148715CF|nr:uncharacterized protein LOC117747909 isoform X2 [Cyclopterus lumpus]
MPLTVRNSARRRRKTPDKKLPERPEEATSSAAAAARVMAPMRMKLRARRRDNVAADAAAEGDQQQQEEEEEGGRSRGSSRRRKTGNTTAASTTATPAASWSPPPPSSSASVRAAMAVAEEASPDSKCPICLDRFNNLAYLDRCLHRFCFPCIQEWSHNKAECPLCKQPFASILHSVRAEDDFKEYTLRPPPANSSVAATVAMVAAMASAARSDHQMRLMLRRHRGADGGEATTRRRRGGRGGVGGGRRSGVWEWYLDTPPLTLPPLPRHPAVSPVVAEDSEEGEDPGERRTRGGADLTERGVIFEGLTGLGGAVVPQPPNDRASRRLMTRLAARQRLQREGGTVRRLRERETVAFRRALYRNAIRVAGVGGNHRQQRDITAESFRRNPSHLNRLRPWLRRELTVLYGAHGSLVDIVQRIIMARVARHGLEDTPTIEEELRQFLLARTDHFLHELVSFARSPLSLESYDLQATYEPPDAAMELDGTSSSSDSSSVIAISEGEEEEGTAGGRSAERLLAMACGTHDDVVQAGSCLSLATWDDETPGPSYSTADPSRSLASPQFGHAPREEANEEEGGDKEECLIVGYKKPIAERTPELVQLSSDTEEEERKKTTEELPRLHSATPPLSYLPTIPPSTSGGERNDEPKEKDGSWSGSSGGNSVCALSPAAPGKREQRPVGDGKSGGEMAREEEEKKKKKKKKRRSMRKRRRGQERSGTLYNPNRSIYPAMMRHRSHSSSPFHSSVGSPDSTWEYHCAQVSPLTSSVSSPSRCSSSSFSSSSSQPPAPIPSLSPNCHHGEKPGGKRKYKSRHLDSDDRDPSWRPSSREKEARRRLERSRRADRSPSVEIIYEGVVSPNAAQTPARKRRRKQQRGTRHSSSPVIITLDSDSSLDAASSSSPISSQQTVDFSDLPPLPSVHSDGVGGALGAEIGELPVDILDRGSEGSEVEPASRSEVAGLVAIDDGDNSEHDVDVENLEESSLLLDDEDNDEDGPMGATAANPRGSRPIGEKNAASTNPIEALSSDSRLLASILDDLKGIAPPKRTPVNFDPSWSTETRPATGAADQNRGFDSPACRSAVRPSPLERLKESSGRKEVKDVPPLLKQASPVRSYNRHTPPPLKHKDAGSPHRSPVDSPLVAVGVNSHVDPKSNPIDSRPEDPSSVLKRHFTRGDPASTSSISANDVRSSCHFAPFDSHSAAPSEVQADGINSTSHKPSADARSSSGLENSLHLEFTSSSKLHSSRDSGKEISSSGLRASPVDLHPVNSLSAIDFHSTKTGWCNEKPADSTSRGCMGETDRTSSCLVAPVDLHPTSSASAEGTQAGGVVFSGVDHYDTSPPAFVSSFDFRTPCSPIDSHSSSKREGRFRGSSVPTAAPSGRLSPIDVHPSPKSTVDLHSSSAAAEELTDSEASSVINHGVGSPHARLPPIDVHCPSPLPPVNLHSSSTTIDGHLNHTSSATFDSKLLQLHNHFDPRCNSQFPVGDRSECGVATGDRSECGVATGDRSECGVADRLEHGVADRSECAVAIGDRSECVVAVGDRSECAAPFDSRLKDSRRNFQLPLDDRIASPPGENQWNTNPSIDARSDSQSPIDEHVWNTHTHTAT